MLVLNDVFCAYWLVLNDVFCGFCSTCLIEWSVVAQANMWTWKKWRKPETVEFFLEVEYKNDEPVTSLDVCKSIIYVTTQLAKNTHQQVITQQNTQNTASWGFHASEKNQSFLMAADRDVKFSLRNNFACLGSFPKTSVPE